MVLPVVENAEKGVYDSAFIIFDLCNWKKISQVFLWK